MRKIDLKSFDGKHQREGRVRRRLKVAVLLLIIIWLFLTTSWVVWSAPEQEKRPTEQDVAVMRNLYRVSSGHNGDANDFLTEWPEYADEIIGEE